jgi:hypothetical protein
LSILLEKRRYLFLLWVLVRELVRHFVGESEGQ